MSWIPKEFAKMMDGSIIANRFIEIDRWSSLHIFSGLILGLIAQKVSKRLWIRLLFALVIMIGYELWENRFWYIFYIRESLVNVVWDIIIGLIGFGLIELWRWEHERR